MSEVIRIRKAVQTDIEEIADYNIQMAKETEDKRLYRASVLKGVKAVLEDPCKGFYLVAEEKRGTKNGIVGQLMITFEWSDWRNKWFWWMQSVYVDSKFRNQKIFTKLYKETLRLAKLDGDVCGLRLYVEEHNKSAKNVYKTLGITRTCYEMYEMLF